MKYSSILIRSVFLQIISKLNNTDQIIKKTLWAIFLRHFNVNFYIIALCSSLNLSSGLYHNYLITYPNVEALGICGASSLKGPRQHASTQNYLGKDITQAQLCTASAPNSTASIEPCTAVALSCHQYCVLYRSSVSFLPGTLEPRQGGRHKVSELLGDICPGRSEHSSA